MRIEAVVGWLAILSLAAGQAEVPSVAGTSWSGKDSEGRAYVFRFLPDGQVDYTSPDGTFRNGTWKQTGAAIYWELNNKFVEYTGSITGDSMSGTAENKLGKKKSWTFRRDGADPPPEKPLVPTLTGTVWSGTDKDDRLLVLEFEKEGKLKYEYAGESFDNGTWSQDGDEVRFEMNNKFAEYEGKRVGGELVGTAKNARGEAWAWKLKEGRPEPKPAPPEPKAETPADQPKPSATSPAPSVPDPQPKPNATPPVPLTLPPATTAPKETAPAPAATTPQPEEVRADVPPPVPTPPAPAATTPATPVAPVPTAPTPEPQRQFAGSTWKGKDSDGDPIEFEFLPGGSGISRRGALVTRSVRWRLDGDRLTIEVNNGYSRYEGRVDGKRARGDASNRQGRTWTWNLVRVPSQYDLAGTSWSGKDSDGEAFTFRFLDGGEVEFVRERDVRTATWRVDGERLIVQVNKGYSTYIGTLKGNIMEGTAANIKGMKWNWRVRQDIDE